MAFTTVGVVLAGGESRRMGEPKALLKLPSGRTFLENALDLLSQLTDVQIIAGGEPELAKGLNYQSRWIKDLHPRYGPLAGIEAALATQLGSGYLVVACDQPRLSVKLLSRLLKGDMKRIHAFQVEADIIPLPLYAPQSAENSLLNIMGGANKSARYFIEACDYELIHLPREEVPLLQSINTPVEYKALLSSFNSI